MKSMLVLVILAFAAAAFAIPTPTEKFLNASFEADQWVTVSSLFGQGSFAVVSADGKEVYVIDTGTGKPVADKQAMAALLVADLKNRTGFDAKVEQAAAFPDAAKNAKAKLEADCMRLTGTDMHDCNDKDTCVLACMSNPNCMNVLYSDGFWEAVLEWTNERKNFGALLASYSDGVGGVSSSGATVEVKSSLLDRLASSSAKMTTNTIFLNRTDEGCGGATATKRCYEYCPKVDYSAARIASQKADLNALKNAHTGIASQPARADAIIAAGAANDNYLATRGNDYQELKLKMQSDLRKLNKSSAELAEKVNDTAIAPMMSSLASFSAQIVADGASGLYRKALGKKSAYEAKHKEVSDRIDSDSRQYDDVAKEISALQVKVAKGKILLGGASASAYESVLARIKSNLTVVTLEQLSSMKSDLSALKVQLIEELAEKATGGGAPDDPAPTGNGSGTQGAAPPAAGGIKLPCLPAFVIACAGLVAFLRKE